mgnify:CR=1 FL=1
MAQLASVLAWGASGRQFESDYPDEPATIFKNGGLFYYSVFL